jgi:cobalt-zinc-cadmium efflux system outer membrane protein
MQASRKLLYVFCTMERQDDKPSGRYTQIRECNFHFCLGVDESRPRDHSKLLSSIGSCIGQVRSGAAFGRLARFGVDVFACVAIASATMAFALDATATDEFIERAPLDRLSLSDAEQLLRQHSRELRASQRAVDAAKAGILIAGARPNPNLTLQTSNINPHVGIGAGGLRDKAFDTQIRTDYLVERGQKRALRLASAGDLERASEDDLDETFRTQRTVLATAYYDLLLAQERIRIAHETAELYGATLSAARRRLAAGDISTSDVDRISVDALRAQGDEQSATTDRQHGQFALAAVLGLESSAGRITATDDWPEPADLQASEDADALLKRRPDVSAARARADAAQHARDLARSLRTRDVTVAVTYDHWPTSASNLQGTGNSYGISLSVPLFLGNHFDGDIAKAESDWGAALDLLDKSMASARADLARTQVDLERMRDRMARYDRELLIAAKRVAEAQEFAYQKGAIGILDLLDARRTLRSIQLDATTAHADYAKALATWRLARPSTTRNEQR